MKNIEEQLPLNPSCGGSKKTNYGAQLLGCSTPFLPLEVIERILLLLLPKSIGRCRCVSKQWLALLSSPQFIEAHTSIIRTRARHARSVFIFSSNTSWLGFTLTNHNQVTASGPRHNLHLPKHFFFLDSCDGLALLLENASQTFLINPTTRHTREIPTVITRCADDPMTRSTTTTITFDGIGFDSVTNDYKVVSVSQIYNPRVDDSSHELFVHIYSVNDGTWKTRISLPNFFGYRLLRRCSPGVFVGRCIHWVTRRDADHLAAIIAFDVVEEKLCQVPIPTHHSFKCMPHRYDYRLGVVAGCLCVTTVIRCHLGVWVMNKYGVQESWTRIAKLGGENEKGLFRPLCFLGQDNLVLEFCKPYKREKFVTYNVTEKTFKDVDTPDGIKDLDYLSVPFAETMVSPYGMRGEC